ncbi:hypothetical protein [uncultured Solobacterium sp.]|uniref:hypothetical protein n=1 Tax=uncultured Solobacterium sp. TaxID=747375 RepID=UPI0028DD1529|nr:hypothetical protein [uncultured Solobacterium sp.]
MKTSNKRKIVSSAALGLALLMTPTLASRSAIHTYAQAALTADEEAKIQAFLATQPQNNDTTNIGKVAVTQPSSYTFPDVNNYTSLFQSRSTKVNIDQDYEYTIESSDANDGKRVKIKNWASVEAYDIFKMGDGNPTPLGYEDKFLYAKEVTLIDTADGSEFTVKNAVFPVNNPDGDRGWETLWYNRYTFDLPIEATDPRFQPEIEDASLIPLYGNGYWTLHATVTEMVPYETIVKIDESLKTGEVEEDVAGTLGGKTGKYDIMYSPTEDLQGDTYKQYTSDVIYADLLANVDTEPAVYDMLSKPWGDATVTDFTSSPATNRVLRVGIDYTHFVTEDGTPVTVSGANVDKKFGLKDKEDFEGYEYVTTRTEANGDRVHVYKKIVETPAEPENTPVPETPETPTQPETPAPVTPETPAQPEAPAPATPETPAQPEASATVAPAVQSTPKTGDAGLFTSAFMLFTGMIGSVGAYVTKKRNSEN